MWIRKGNTEHRTRNSRARPIITNSDLSKTLPSQDDAARLQGTQRKENREVAGLRRRLQETAIKSREVPPGRRPGTTVLKDDCPRNKIATQVTPTFKCSRRTSPISRRSPGRIFANLPGQSGRDAWLNVSVWIGSSSQMGGQSRLAEGDCKYVCIHRASAATI